MFKNKRLLICAAILIITTITVAAIYAPRYLEERAWKSTHKWYDYHLLEGIEKSYYPGKIAAIVETYDFYKNELFYHYKGKRKSELKSDFETYISHYIVDLPDNYSIPRECVDDELIKTLEELESKDFLEEREQDIVSNLLESV